MIVYTQYSNTTGYNIPQHPESGTTLYRHTKASHWLEDGMNIVQISFFLGHSNVQTTMTYLDITTEQEEKALATLEDENDKEIPKK